jgi:hypothetical protein
MFECLISGGKYTQMYVETYKMMENQYVPQGDPVLPYKTPDFVQFYTMGWLGNVF